jgi:hypothetical protein
MRARRKITPALIVILLSVFGLPGCAAFSGVQPTNLEPILVGKARAHVEAVLGTPSERKPNGCGTIDTYRYNRGRPPESRLIALGMVHPAAPLVVGLVAHPFLYYGQKGELDIVYDPNDIVIKYGPRNIEEWDGLFSYNHLWVDQTTRHDVAEHYYEIGMAGAADGGTARNCLCHAASLGHFDSQVQVAKLFRPEPEPEDNGSHRVYASLAPVGIEKSPGPMFDFDGLETGASPHSVTELDRLVSERTLAARSCGFEIPVAEANTDSARNN